MHEYYPKREYKWCTCKKFCTCCAYKPSIGIFRHPCRLISGVLSLLRLSPHPRWFDLPLQAMVRSDPEAIWLMQGWLFQNTWWKTPQIQAYLGGVATAKMWLLDLFGDSNPIWVKTASFYGHPYIWCTLLNFGGQQGMIQIDLRGHPFIVKHAFLGMHGHEKADKYGTSHCSMQSRLPKQNLFSAIWCLFYNEVFLTRWRMQLRL